MLSDTQRAIVPWRPFGNNAHAEATRGHARQIALSIACKMKNPRRLERDVALALSQPGLPSQKYWRPHSLSQGCAGLTLMFAHLARCFPNDGWEVASLEYFELAVSDSQCTRDVPMGAFTGLAGLLFAGRYLEETLNIQLHATVTLEHNLVAKAATCVEALHDRRGVAVTEVDVISGLSGVWTVLQTYGSSYSTELNHQLLEVFTRLSEDDSGLPRLHCPKSMVNPEDSIAKQFTHGFLNCGMAHGIPGPLFALCLAGVASPKVPSTECAIARLAKQLIMLRGADEWGPNWPAAVPAASFGSGLTPVSPQDKVNTRTAWCYGNPGVSRSLRLAGESLRSKLLLDEARISFESVSRRPWRMIESPTFCHGMAGLLQVAARYASEERTNELVGFAEACAVRLIEMYDPGRPLGYSSIEMGKYHVDQPGLLDGAAGAILSLLSFSEAENPTWDRIFCIS